MLTKTYMTMKIKFIVLLFCLPFIGFSQSISNNLLLYYPMNGNANDFSGNNYHGTVNGATLVPDQFGNTNSAYYFDGINDYIDFPINSILKPTYPLTISFLANLGIISLQKTKFINTDYVADDYFGVSMNVDDFGYLRIGFGGGNGLTNSSNRTTFTSTTMTVTTGVWYRFTGIIHSETDMDLYIDCVDVNAVYDSGTGSTIIGYTNYAPGSLGRSDGAGPAQYYQGAMDELMYWDRALTQTEILSLCERTFNILSWDCIGNSCVDPGNGSGMYTDSLNCVSNCKLPSWDCIANSCVDPGNGSGMYALLLSCQASCGHTTVNEFNVERKLLRIVDVLGRNAKKESNVPLFYFYNDGAVEKKFIID